MLSFPKTVYLSGVCLALVACSSSPKPATPDGAEIARAVLEELAQDVPASEADLPPSATSNEPIWQLAQNGAGLEHTASGFICPATSGTFKMLGEEIYPGLTHGNDVACIYEAAEGGAVKLHLTNFGRDVSPSAHLKGVATSISDTYNTSGQTQVPRTEDGPQYAHATAFRLRVVSELRPDVPVHTAVWIEQAVSWHVKVRATYEADRADAVAALVEDLLAGTDNITALTGAASNEPPAT